MKIHSHTLTIAEYVKWREPTDGMGDPIAPVIFGLYGEVGSVMSTSKKLHREKDVYVGYRNAAVEELGDVVWYLTAVSERLGLDLESVFREAFCDDDEDESQMVATSLHEWPVAVGLRAQRNPNLEEALFSLGVATSKVVELSRNPEVEQGKKILAAVAREIVHVHRAAEISLGESLTANLQKTRGRFLKPDFEGLPLFDAEFDEDEQIPREFEIYIRQRKSGKTYLQMNGVFLGDPLTDNIKDQDGYRFHDVFHLAHAAVLAWSPVIRALLKRKRKSNADVDEHQDSGRAIVVEEGLTAWVFSQAKEVGLFKGQSSLSFDMLKTIQRFVAGYEVESCPLKLWEEAILQGYSAFRELNKNNEGVIVGDIGKRQIRYRRH